MPALEESDAKTDDKILLSESPTFESGRDILEYDMWSDHPAWQLNLNWKLNNQHDFHFHRKQHRKLIRTWDAVPMEIVRGYEVVISVPLVKNKCLQEFDMFSIHCKYIEEKKERKVKHCKSADSQMLQAELAVPSIEALMGCPLSKYIHFAANDCSYRGLRHELIANCVRLWQSLRGVKRITQIGSKQ